MPHFEVENEELRAIAANIPEVLSTARSTSTLKSYKTYFERWEKWSNRFHEVTAMPAEPKFISIYLISLLQSDFSFSVISQTWYAIKYYHDICNFPSPSDNVCVNILEAIKRILAKPSNKKLPINVNHLRNVLEAFGGQKIGKLEHLRTITFAIISYAGFLRFSECINIRRSDILIAETHARIFIEKSKTDKYRDGHWLHVARLDSDLCPIKMLERYFSEAGICRGDTKFIFRAIQSTSKGETLRQIDKHVCYETIRKQVLNAIKPFVEDIGKYGLHSLRRGGATAAANLGVNDRLFQKHGRWKSENIKNGYVEEDLNSLLHVTRNIGL